MIYAAKHLSGESLREMSSYIGAMVERETNDILREDMGRTSDAQS
jgi:hypothetical protein